jgi:hypothetical protein
MTETQAGELLVRLQTISEQLTRIADHLTTGVTLTAGPQLHMGDLDIVFDERIREISRAVPSRRQPS